jgi:hypothetical protein
LPEKIVIYSELNGEGLDFGDQPVASSLPVVSKTIKIAVSDTTFCDQVIISGSGVTVQGPNVTNDNGFMLTQSPNSNHAWVFPHGSTKDHGYPLDYGNHITLAVSNLNQVDFATDNGNGAICWIKL